MSSPTCSGKLAKLRSMMKVHKITACIVPSQDAHLSEYVAEVDKRREWLSGFTGSAGTAVVTAEKALLWTDGRYYEQAERELSSDWELVRAADAGVRTVPQYLVEELQQGAIVGINPELISVSTALQWDKTMLKGAADRVKDVTRRLPLQLSNGTAAVAAAAAKQTEPLPHHVLLTATPHDFVDEIWTDQPKRPGNAIYEHPEEIAGQGSKEKIAAVRQEMTGAGASCIVVSALDEIAWTLNLRGSDIAYTPVFFAYLVISHSKVCLFVDLNAVSEELASSLREKIGCDELHAYDKFDAFLSDSLAELAAEGGEPSRKRAKTETTATAAKGSGKTKVWLDPDTCCLKIKQRCEQAEGLEVLSKPSPIKRAKAIKNLTELEGMRRAHVLEGAALCEFFAWLEDAVVNRNEVVDEIAASEELERLRSKEPSYEGPSFETISAFGKNAAVIHYSSKRETSKVIGTDSLYLCDTGGQYATGTTDMTRTVCLGTPSAFQKLAFTLVLEGHINLARARFFQGTEPTKLDVLARAPLWQHGLDYKHGTSHGVGAFLGVHEYPPLMHGSLPRFKPFKGKFSPTSLAANMVMSNEPGYYQTGDFGIRIETVVITKSCKDKLEHADRYDKAMDWIEMETITFVPIQTKLIDTHVLSKPAIEWVNEYHRQCRERVAPVLQERGATAALAWLERETQPIVFSDDSEGTG